MNRLKLRLGTFRMAAVLALALVLSGCLSLLRSGHKPPVTFQVDGVVLSIPDQNPIEGARVRVNGSKTNTGADGKFALAEVPVIDGRAWYVVEADGYAGLSGSVSVSADVVSLDLYMRSSAQVGDEQVSGHIGYAVPGFTVGACPASSFQPTRGFTTQADATPQHEESREVIVELIGPPTPEIGQTLVLATRAQGYRISRYIDRLILTAPEEVDLDGFIQQLLARPEVVDAYANEQVFTLMDLWTPNDPCYTVQHHLHQANVSPAWTVTTGDTSIVVAVLDTGVDVDHPDLGMNTLPGWNFYTDSEDVTDDSLNGHGTHVAGIIGAVTNNSIGGAGVAWNVSILPIKVLRSSGGGSLEAVAAGIRYAVDAGAHILNMSFGIPHHGSDYPVVREAIEEAAAKGVVLIAAAGNQRQGYTTTTYPARYNQVIGVGATSMDDPTSIADFSLRGPGIDVVAPGEEVWSTVPGGLYRKSSGTSMAAPVVSGVAALMLANDAAPEGIQAILRDTAVRIGDPQSDVETLHTYGYGLVNAYAAVLGLDVRDASVFVMDAAGSVYGDATSPGSKRQFTVDNLPRRDDLYLAGWLDVNGSNTLDDGDYFGAAPLSDASYTESVYLPLEIHPSPALQGLNTAAQTAIANLGFY